MINFDVAFDRLQSGAFQTNHEAQHWEKTMPSCDTEPVRRGMRVTTKSHVCRWLLIWRAILKLFISQCEMARATKIRYAYLCSSQTEKSYVENAFPRAYLRNDDSDRR